MNKPEPIPFAVNDQVQVNSLTRYRLIKHRQRHPYDDRTGRVVEVNGAVTVDWSEAGDESDMSQEPAHSLTLA